MKLRPGLLDHHMQDLVVVLLLLGALGLGDVGDQVGALLAVAVLLFVNRSR